jgi:uncharacterized protein YjaG (DUF416 family)
MEAAFDIERTRAALAKLLFHQQLAFGAACCERMLPNYETFMREVGWGEVLPLRHALDVVWAACEGRRPREAELRNHVSEVENRIPDSEDFTSLHVASAQDAACAICALLDFLLGGDLDRVVSAAQLSTDSVDLIVQERAGMDPQDPRLEQKILEHPMMQQELVRQRRDLDEAALISVGDRNALGAFRARAASESNLEDWQK